MKLRDHGEGVPTGPLEIDRDDWKRKPTKRHVARGAKERWENEIEEDEEYADASEHTGTDIDPQDASSQLSIEGDFMPPPLDPKGIELSRVSGELDFTDDEDDISARDPEAKKLAEQFKIENVQAWIKDQSDTINQRNFNANDIIGNFPRDWRGQIADRDIVLREAGRRDRAGNAVNERGYLIDEHTGDVRSRYTFDVVFNNFDMVGTANGDRVELPLPQRLERHNFNPHSCMGNFDYDEHENPLFFEDKAGQRIDKNLRRVNGAGWLVDEEGNIIDNQGQIKFVKEQLVGKKGELPTLFNFEGVEFDIKHVIGIFERDRDSKEIVLCHNTKKGRHTSYDLKGRKVNSKGYLLDERGNIIDKSFPPNIIWRSHELMYNEPPKIFRFTEFSINWIKGLVDHDVTQNPKHDDEFDLEGRRINAMGYLVDHVGNIVDIFGGNVVFKKEILFQ